MSHIQEAKDIGMKALVEKHWDDPVDIEQMAETIVLTQQSKVLHKENEFWTNPRVFCRRMLPVVKRYHKVIANQLSAQKNKLSDEKALQVKGVIGLDWHAMAKLDELEDACEATMVSKTTTTSPSQLVERKFSKVLLDYYNSEKNPEVPLQAIYYAILFWVHEMSGSRVVDSDGNELEDDDDGAEDVEEDYFNPKYRYD